MSLAADDSTTSQAIYRSGRMHVYSAASSEPSAWLDVSYWRWQARKRLLLLLSEVERFSAGDRGSRNAVAAVGAFADDWLASLLSRQQLTF